MRSFLVYSLLRLVIFLACFGVLYVLFGAQVSAWLIALPALLLTSGLSWLLLRKRGADAGKAMTTGMQAMRRRLDDATSKEDVPPLARGDEAAGPAASVEGDPASPVDAPSRDQAQDSRP